VLHQQISQDGSQEMVSYSYRTYMGNFMKHRFKYDEFILLSSVGVTIDEVRIGE
jgi:hypothetical protein